MSESAPPRSARARLRAALFAAIGLALVGPAHSETAAPNPPCAGRDLAEGLNLDAARRARADDLVDSQGLLWRIERNGLAPSYLFGTIHSTDPSAVALARQAAENVASVKVVATELGAPLGPIERADLSGKILAKAIARDADTFVPALSRAEAASVEAYLARRGFPAEMAHHLQLWFLAVSVALPSCETARAAEQAPEVDEVIAEAGRARGLPVIGLETTAEQIDAIAAAPPELSATLLETSARTPSLEDDAYVTLLRLYREKRPAEMLAVGDVIPGLTLKERAAEDAFTRLLLVARNETMAARAAPLLAKGGAFIAVGALHLAGKAGLIERFRAMGYRVADVW